MGRELGRARTEPAGRRRHAQRRQPPPPPLARKVDVVSSGRMFSTRLLPFGIRHRRCALALFDRLVPVRLSVQLRDAELCAGTHALARLSGRRSRNRHEHSAEEQYREPRDRHDAFSFDIKSRSSPPDLTQRGMPCSNRTQEVPKMPQVHSETPSLRGPRRHDDPPSGSFWPGLAPGDGTARPGS